jgi:D-alanine-D-alanine ligase
MDKSAAKAVFTQAGLPVARSVLVTLPELENADPLPLPYVVKPNAEGSSVGVEIVRDGSNRRREIARTWQFGSHALVEEFIPGRELTVSVLGDRALAVTEIVAGETSDGFYDFEAKYTDGGSRHIVPAEIPAPVAARAMDVALAAHRALGCRGASRADFRLDGDRLILLEVNTQPGMTPTSLLPEQAIVCGMSYSALCAWMVGQAACRA